MRTQVNGAARVVAAFAISTAVAAFATADGSQAQADEEGRWAPGLALAGGVTVQKMNATVESFILPPPLDTSRCTPPGVLPCGLLDPGTGNETAVSPYFGFDFELMAPAIEAIPWRPRFFVDAEILVSFGATLDVAKEGGPGDFGLPFSPPSLPNPVTGNPGPCPSGNCFPEGAITGVGSKTTSVVRPLTTAAGLGVAFPFKLAGRQLRVKPSVGWIRYEMDVSGVVTKGIKPDRDHNFIRFVTLEASTRKSYNGIGPGIEVELDANRFGPFRTSLYVEGHAYRVLGDRSDRSVVLRETVTIEDDGFHRFNHLPSHLATESYTADWSFEAEPWIWRGGVGVRIRWLPK